MRLIGVDMLCQPYIQLLFLGLLFYLSELCQKPLELVKHLYGIGPLFAHLLYGLVGGRPPRVHIIQCRGIEPDALFPQCLTGVDIVFTALSVDLAEDFAQLLFKDSAIIGREFFEGLFVNHQTGVEVDQRDVGEVFDAGVPLQGDGSNR